MFQRKIQADNNNIVTDEDDVDDESILKWRAPQHRQFLSNEVNEHSRLIDFSVFLKAQRGPAGRNNI